jgi:hypothetical protein
LQIFSYEYLLYYHFIILLKNLSRTQNNATCEPVVYPKVMLAVFANKDLFDWSNDGSVETWKEHRRYRNYSSFQDSCGNKRNDVLGIELGLLDSWTLGWWSLRLPAAWIGVVSTPYYYIVTDSAHHR